MANSDSHRLKIHDTATKALAVVEITLFSRSVSFTDVDSQNSNASKDERPEASKSKVRITFAFFVKSLIFW